MTKKQKLMIVGLKSSACNISQACKAANISRQTHYDWLDKSDTYKKEYEDVLESLLDFAEGALMKQIKKGNVASTIFFLKTKAKGRGYVEKQDFGLDLAGSLDVVVKFVE